MGRVGDGDLWHERAQRRVEAPTQTAGLARLRGIAAYHPGQNQRPATGYSEQRGPVTVGQTQIFLNVLPCPYQVFKIFDCK